MTREEKLQYLLNQIPKNASGMYKEGFEDGFECTYDAVEKDFEAQLWFADMYVQDHEAQLKAKESDLERQDMIIKCLNIDLDNKENVLKAKDEEIERLKAELNSAFIRDLKSIKMSSNGKHATWGMLKDQQ